jgi:hypothetical protein
MSVLLAALFSLAAFAFVLTTSVMSSVSYTTHIGSRTPPAKADCIQTGEFRTERDKLLKIYKCPT